LSPEWHLFAGEEMKKEGGRGPRARDVKKGSRLLSFHTRKITTLQEGKKEGRTRCFGKGGRSKRPTPRRKKKRGEHLSSLISRGGGKMKGVANTRPVHFGQGGGKEGGRENSTP